MSPRRSLHTLTSFALLLLLATPILRAQNFELVAPKQPDPIKKPAKLPDTEPPLTATASDAIVIESLLGLVLVDQPNHVLETADAATVRGLRAKELPLVQKSDFTPIASRYLGHPVTQKSMSELMRDIILYYREHDHPVVDVYAPEQDVTDGVLQVVVIEGRVGEKKVEGNRWFGSESLTREIRLKKGDTIDARQLLADLDWLNRNPFREVDLIYSRGQALGTTDLVLQAHDRFPVRFFTGYEDTGNELTGEDRWLGGFNWGDAFGLGHQMNYQFTSSGNFESYHAYSGSYVIPLPWRHLFTVYGGYAESAAIGDSLIGLKGRSWQISGRYTIPLPGTSKLVHEVFTGFDFKVSNNNLDFGGSSVYRNATDIDQFVFGYNGSLTDDWGATNGGVTVYYSPGNMTGANHDNVYIQARADATDNYTYTNFVLERITKLPWDFTWNMRGQAQIANENLLGSEQMGLGGYATVRGYEEREINGDQGWFLSEELRTPPISLCKILTGSNAAQDNLQFLVFWDYGVLNNVTLQPGERAHTTLASVGPGLRYRINTYASLRFDYGFQLKDSGANTKNEASRGHLGFVLSY